MRHFSAFCIIAILAFVQLGVAHSAVCRTLMQVDESATGHCAKKPVPRQADCSGMGGCAELCRGKASELPAAAGKESPQVFAQSEASVSQCAPQAAVAWDAWAWPAPPWRADDSSESPPQRAFILFHSLLI